MTYDPQNIIFPANQIPSDAIADNQSHISLTAMELQNRATTVKNHFYPEPQILNSVSMVHRGGKYSTNFIFEENRDGTVTLNGCNVSLDKGTGQLVRYSSVGINNYHRRPTISLTPTFNREKAIKIALWALTHGKPIKFDILLPSEYTSRQREILKMPSQNPAGYHDVQLKIEEDAWLHQRLVWEFDFNVGEVYLDAHTGHVIHIAAAPQTIGPEGKDFFNTFALPQSKVFAPPVKAPIADEVLEMADVRFNRDPLYAEDSLDGLHYQPIIRDDSPLIFSEYFPNFLINLETKGDEITLEGQLKEKHKAVLKLGEKKYTLDGKEAEFATPPVKIDDRVYLPAELLQQLNGVLIRWEPKKKLLWVDTRYLRR